MESGGHQIPRGGQLTRIRNWSETSQPFSHALSGCLLIAYYAPTMQGKINRRELIFQWEKGEETDKQGNLEVK